MERVRTERATTPRSYLPARSTRLTSRKRHLSGFILGVGTVDTEVTPKPQEEAKKPEPVAKTKAPSYTKPQFFGAHGCTSSQQSDNWTRLTKYGESKGLSHQDINTWIELTRRESNFCHIAQNPTSTAFGIGQFLNATWKAYGYTKTRNPDIQIQAKYDYIMKRYGSVESAKNFHDINNWY